MIFGNHVRLRLSLERLFGFFVTSVPLWLIASASIQRDEKRCGNNGDYQNDEQQVEH
jgi:hypothetical protein